MVERPAIEILSDEVIDQIAAGEVVERPASVVKELVENAIDAGASSISIEIDGGGKRLIRVVDDGVGMTGEEVRVALRRHATSKLRAVTDLFSLDTMGFRGEALPSIASVSRMSIATRPRGVDGAVAATRLEIEGGRIVDTAEVGAPVGTQIEVRDLLYNVPARLKFLRGDSTETAHVNDAVSKLAMAHPRVRFSLKHRGRTTLSAPLHKDCLERVRALLGTRVGGKLHSGEGEEAGIQVSAFLAAPELAQTTSRGLQLFVGRRPVRDRGLLHAVSQGYGELIPRGRYPVAVIFVDVPDGAVDVNVHPQKLEVRFSDAQAVYAAVRHTVRRVVAQAPWLSEPAELASAPIRMEVLASSTPPERARASELAASYASMRNRSLFSVGRGLERARFPMAPAVRQPAPAVSDGEAGSQRAVEPKVDAPKAPESEAAVGQPSATESAASGDFFQTLRYLGQLDRTYLLCEAAGELVLIDQHAAHERVAFQRLRERYHERAVPVQHLLFPQTVELDDAEAAAAGESSEALAAVGFALEPFGGATFALKAVPAGLRAGDPVAVLRDLLRELSEHGGSRAVDERLDAMFATIACHSVVRAGDVLSGQEVAALLRDMDGVDFRAHCPHGRPVLLRISTAEIARRFGRT